MMLLSQGDVESAQLIFRLLRNATSQPFVRDFLKQKGVPSSSQNWDDLFSRRIQPALNDGVVSLREFRQLLQDVEEHGRQHTFLFKCDPNLAVEMMDSGRIQAIAAEQGLTGLLSQPLDLDLPSAPSIVDIRREVVTGVGQRLTIKVVETRTTQVFVDDDIDPVAGTLRKLYCLEKKRAVNIAQLDATGMLEIRIASQDNSTRYQSNVQALRQMVGAFILPENFTEITLTTAKNRLFERREELADEVRYSHSAARNDFGFSMNVSASSQAENLSTDGGSIAAMRSFLASDGHITASNIYMKIPNSDKEVHLLISGDQNEFAIPVACSGSDYSYVRGKILELNQ